jgi:hypothetical protein
VNRRNLRIDPADGEMITVLRRPAHGCKNLVHSRRRKRSRSARPISCCRQSRRIGRQCNQLQSTANRACLNPRAPMVKRGAQSCRLGVSGSVRMKPVPPHFGQSISKGGIGPGRLSRTKGTFPVPPHSGHGIISSCSAMASSSAGWSQHDIRKTGVGTLRIPQASKGRYFARTFISGARRS